MKIFNEEEVDKAALESYSYLPDQACKYEDELTGEFKSGVEYAESKVEDLCIEFAEWMFTSPMILTDMQGGVGSNLTTKELFEQFLKERNGK